MKCHLNTVCSCNGYDAAAPNVLATAHWGGAQAPSHLLRVVMRVRAEAGTGGGLQAEVRPREDDGVRDRKRPRERERERGRDVLWAHVQLERRERVRNSRQQREELLAGSTARGGARSGG